MIPFHLVTLVIARCTTQLIHIFCLHKRVETQDNERFPDAWKGIEKPFKMYNNSKKITVKLLPDPKKGWELDETPGEQVRKSTWGWAQS